MHNRTSHVGCAAVEKVLQPDSGALKYGPGRWRVCEGVSYACRSVRSTVPCGCRYGLRHLATERQTYPGRPRRPSRELRSSDRLCTALGRGGGTGSAGEVVRVRVRVRVRVWALASGCLGMDGRARCGFGRQRRLEPNDASAATAEGADPVGLRSNGDRRPGPLPDRAWSRSSRLPIRASDTARAEASAEPPSSCAAYEYVPVHLASYPGTPYPRTPVPLPNRGPGWSPRRQRARSTHVPYVVRSRYMLT